MNDTDASTTRHDIAGNRSAFDHAGHTITIAIGDLLALERQLREPLRRQAEIADGAAYADAHELIGWIARLADAHVNALELRLNRAGGDPSSPLKAGWGQLAGAGVVIRESLRAAGVAKNLRDDHSTVSLAAISYTMLQATALGLGDEDTAILAKRHFEDYASIIKQLGRVLPGVVLAELRAHGHGVVTTAAAIAERNATESWHAGAGR